MSDEYTELAHQATPTAANQAARSLERMGSGHDGMARAMTKAEWLQLLAIWLIPLIGYAGTADLQLPGVLVVAIVGW